MTNKQDFLVESVVGDIAKWLMSEQSMTVKDALSIIYNSQFFEKLQDPDTGLYAESSAYNYDLLVSEIRNGKIVQADI